MTVQIKELNGTAAEVELEQIPVAQAALIAIDNATGEIKAMVGGYDFEDSKFDRATQAMRQTGSSFKVYVYAEALAQGASPFDTVVDEPVTFHTGSQDYSPHNYDEKFEGRITLRRALADSRNVPAVRLLDKVGIENTIELARKFGLTSPLPPVLPLALGSADLTLIEHTSAFTVFPDDGIHIEPHYLRRVTSYDGAVLEELRPNVTDVIPPDVARTMVAMLEDVVQFGTGVRAKEIGRPSGGKTGTTNDFTDAWYIGFTPQITSGVWVGNDAHVTLGKKETGARAALPIWIRIHAAGHAGHAGGEFPECGAARKTWRRRIRCRWIRRIRRLPPMPPSKASRPQPLAADGSHSRRAKSAGLLRAAGSHALQPRLTRRSSLAHFAAEGSQPPGSSALARVRSHPTSMTPLPRSISPIARNLRESRRALAGASTCLGGTVKSSS